MGNKAKNPFPDLRVAPDPESKRLEKYTFISPEISRCLNLLSDFLEKKERSTILVSGAAGSGKSHLINYVITEGRKKYKYSKEGKKNNYLEIFIKRASKNFFDTFKRNIFPHIQKVFTDMERNPIRRILSRITADELEKYEWAETKVEELKKGDIGPEQILQELFFDSQKIITDFSKTLGEDLEKDYGYEQYLKDVANIYYHLKDIPKQPLALRWLKGDRLEPFELDRLGVADQFSKDSQALYAFIIFIRLLNILGQRILFFVDEFDITIESIESEKLIEFRGLFRTLMEVLANEESFLIIAATDEAWSRFDPAALGRPVNLISLQKLDNEKSKDVLARYSPDFKELFSPSALNLLLKTADGNPRTLLTLAFFSYKRVSSIPINDTDVAFALQNTYIYLQSDIMKELKEVLTDEKREFLSKRRISLDSKKIECDLIVGKTKNPVAIIEISKSAYLVEERKRAQEIINKFEQLKEYYSDTRLILILDGYISDDLIETFDRYFDRVIQYDPRTFKEELKNAIRTIPSEERKLISEEETEELKNYIARSEEVSKKMEDLRLGPVLHRPNPFGMLPRSSIAFSGSLAAFIIWLMYPFESIKSNIIWEIYYPVFYILILLTLISFLFTAFGFISNRRFYGLMRFKLDKYRYELDGLIEKYDKLKQMQKDTEKLREQFYLMLEAKHDLEYLNDLVIFKTRDYKEYHAVLSRIEYNLIKVKSSSLFPEL